MHIAKMRKTYRNPYTNLPFFEEKSFFYFNKFYSKIKRFPLEKGILRISAF